MRYIRIPGPIEVFNLATGETTGRKVSFKDFVLGTLLVDKRFGKSVKELQAALRISQAIQQHGAGEVIGLESADWEVLRDTAKEPSSEYLPGVAMQLLLFIEVILDASETAPKNGVTDAPTPPAPRPVDGAQAPVVA